VAEFSDTLKTYGVSKVVGDRYAGEWPREQFSKCGITYDASARPKSDLYRDALPLLNSCRLDLLDNPKMVNQLCALERRVARGSGKDSIDHPPGQHDDLSNVACGLAAANAQSGSYDLSYSWVSGPDSDGDRDGARGWRAVRLAMYLNSGGRIVP